MSTFAWAAILVFPAVLFVAMWRRYRRVEKLRARRAMAPRVVDRARAASVAREVVEHAQQAAMRKGYRVRESRKTIGSEGKLEQTMTLEREGGILSYQIFIHLDESFSDPSEWVGISWRASFLDPSIDLRTVHEGRELQKLTLIQFPLSDGFVRSVTDEDIAGFERGAHLAVGELATNGSIHDVWVREQVRLRLQGIVSKLAVADF